MKGVNKVILVGNLGKDPEVQHLEGGTTLTKFPLATTETYKDKNGQRVEQTEWHNIIVWRQLAEIAEKYLHKGSAIYLEGKLRTRKWTDKDNNTRYTTEIIADSFTMLDRKQDGSSGGSSNIANDVEMPSNDGGDDLPF